VGDHVSSYKHNATIDRVDDVVEKLKEGDR